MFMHKLFGSASMSDSSHPHRETKKYLPTQILKSREDKAKQIIIDQLHLQSDAKIDLKDGCSITIYHGKEKPSLETIKQLTNHFSDHQIRYSLGIDGPLAFIKFQFTNTEDRNKALNLIRSIDHEKPLSLRK